MSGKRLSASSATGVGTLCSLLPAPCRWLSLSPAPPSHNPAISAGLMLPTPSPSVPRTLQRPVLQLPDSRAGPSACPYQGTAPSQGPGSERPFSDLQPCSFPLGR